MKHEVWNEQIHIHMTELLLFSYCQLIIQISWSRSMKGHNQVCSLPSSGTEAALEPFPADISHETPVQVCYQSRWLMTSVRVEQQRLRAFPTPPSTSGVCCDKHSSSHEIKFFKWTFFQLQCIFFFFYFTPSYVILQAISVCKITNSVLLPWQWYCRLHSAVWCQHSPPGCQLPQSAIHHLRWHHWQLWRLQSGDNRRCL